MSSVYGKKSIHCAQNERSPDVCTAFLYAKMKVFRFPSERILSLFFSSPLPSSETSARLSGLVHVNRVGKSCRLEVFDARHSFLDIACVRLFCTLSRLSIFFIINNRHPKKNIQAHKLLSIEGGDLIWDANRQLSILPHRWVYFLFHIISELVQDSCLCICEDYQARDRMIIIMTPYDRIRDLEDSTIMMATPSLKRL